MDLVGNFVSAKICLWRNRPSLS